jgi:hypothetical protein
MILRDSRDGDVPAIAAIYGHWVMHGLASFELEPPGVEEVSHRRAAVLAGGYPYLVAEQGGVVVGYAHASATGRGRPTGSPWKTASMSHRARGAAASGRSCSKPSLRAARRSDSAKWSR